MSSIASELQAKLERLSPQRQAEVADFVDYLLSKEQPKPRTKMKLDWVGCLQDLRDQYTSVELQKEANRWREENAIVSCEEDAIAD